MLEVLKVLIIFGLGAIVYKKNILNFHGSLAAIVMGIVIWLLVGLSWFLLLLIFMTFGVLSTKYKYSYKESIKVAEKDHGRRGVGNVLANGLLPTFIAILFYANSVNFLNPSINPKFIIAGYIAAIASITGDTLSSEIGVLSKNEPVLITTFKKVSRGTHGAISLLGEVVGLLGTMLIGIIAWILKLASFEIAVISAVIGGVVGFHIDSILGAIFERRRLMSNTTVNFLSTVAGSLVGVYVILSF